MLKDKYIAGEPYKNCDRCGLDKRAVETRKEWTGLIVCNECWDPKHPQLAVRGRRERRHPAPSPEPDDVFLSANEITAGDL